MKRDTGFKDRNGKSIYVGDYAIALDREGNEWVGLISYVKAKYTGEFKIKGKPVEEVYVFESNMTVWLGGWTKNYLVIVEPTDEVRIKYAENKELTWGALYSTKTIKTYYDSDPPSWDVRERLHREVSSIVTDRYRVALGKRPKSRSLLMECYKSILPL